MQLNKSTILESLRKSLKKLNVQTTVAFGGLILLVFGGLGRSIRSAWVRLCLFLNSDWLLVTRSGARGLRNSWSVSEEVDMACNRFL